MGALDKIYAQLARLRRGLKTWIVASGVLGLAATMLWVSLLFIGADILLRFRPGTCWFAWAVLLVGLLAVAVVATRFFLRPLGPESISMHVERRRPALRNRLINVVQFARAGRDEDAAFAGELLREEPIDLADVRAGELFPPGIRKWLAIAVLIAGVFSAGLAALSPQAYLASLRRLLMPMAGVQPYSLTRILGVEPGDTSVPKGEGLEVAVDFAGLIPEAPMLVLQSGQADDRLLALSPEPNTAGRFTVRTPPLFEDTVYFVRGGDTRSRRYQVAVDSPPALENWTAHVTPPEYTGLEAYDLAAETKNPEIPQGATVALRVGSSLELREAAARQADEVLATAAINARREFNIEFVPAGTAMVNLDLVSARGLTARVGLPVAILRDQSPGIQFLGDEARIAVDSPSAVVAVEYEATDDYGVAEVRLEQVEAERARELSKAAAEGRRMQQLRGRFYVDLAPFRMKPGDSVNLRFTAVDFGPDAEKRAGRSRMLEVVVPLAEDRQKARDQKKKEADRSLVAVIELQQETLKLTSGWLDEAEHQRDVPASGREAILAKQTEVRQRSIEIVGADLPLGDLVNNLRGLIENEMPQAIAALDRLNRAPDGELVPPLAKAVDLQRAILRVLTGAQKALAAESSYQEKSDLLEQLQKLVAQQKRNLVQTRAAAEKAPGADEVEALVDRQDVLAEDCAVFMDAAKAMIGRNETDEFSQHVAKVHAELETFGIYQQMMRASGLIEELKWPDAVQTEEECLKALARALQAMNEWRLKQARDTREKFADTLHKIKEDLTSMEERQREIAEVAKDYTKRGKLDQELRKEMAKLDEEQKDWKDKLEQMAQDLYQFPDLPVANELNSKMREVYEDCEQAADSEHAEAVEIAVQKEESFLEAIKKTKERVEDIEMWLPDVPDNIKWDMESFDATEFPEMPLVELPEELEDIVGDLLDQDSDIDQQSQDSTGNNMMADGEMGWGVMDGPIPNFSAKGKSGNTRPNDNEMTGRSGAGREGQSTGELVENHVKGLEGRETHVRKTNDKFQTGQVTEDEDSTMEARATGGGKLGGVSEHIGMFGNAPRRDLHMGDGTRTQLRQETEAVYAKARMLYLGNTSRIGAAAQDMRRLERYDGNMRDLNTLGQRVVKRLRDSQTELATGAVLPMSVAGRIDENGASAGSDVDLNDINEEYRTIVADYYRSLGDSD